MYIIYIYYMATKNISNKWNQINNQSYRIILRNVYNTSRRSKKRP